MKIKSLSEVLSTKINEVVIRIPVKYKDEQLFAIIDGQDYDKVKDYKWHVKKSKRSSRIVYYAVRNIKTDLGQSKICMHNVILDPANGFTADHIDGDGLNNTSLNLRLATKQQQGANRTKSANTTSEFKGVSFHKKADKWRVRIQFNGKQSHLGIFSDKKEAAAAYDVEAIELFGEYANLNFKPPLSFLWP